MSGQEITNTNDSFSKNSIYSKIAITAYPIGTVIQNYKFGIDYRFKDKMSIKTIPFIGLGGENLYYVEEIVESHLVNDQPVERLVL
jgi:hypothetical protein